MRQPPTDLTTDRLKLRCPSLADAAAIFEYAADPDVTRYMDWPTHTDIQDTIRFLEWCIPRWESGEEFCWVITAQPADQVIGAIACRIDGHKADFGYVLHRQYWRQGYMTEAARAVIAWLTSLPTIYRVWAVCDTENLASARVLEKVGLRREGTLRCATMRPNLSSCPRDSFIFAKVRDPESGCWAS